MGRWKVTDGHYSQHNETGKEGRPMGLAEDKKQKKRLSLMDAAFGLFTTKGIARTSIEEIARAAGIAKGTFYLYFRDKDDLRRILIRHKAASLLRHALDHSGYLEKEEPADKILAITDDILSQLQEDPILLAFFHRNLSWNTFRQAVEELGDEGRRAIEEVFGPEAGGSRDREVESFMILELIGATCQSVILDREPVDMETYRPYLHRAVRSLMESCGAA